MDIALLQNQIIGIIPNIVTKHISSFCLPVNSKHLIIREIFKSLRFLLNGHYEKYHFDEKAIHELLAESLTEEQFHSILYSLNEKKDVRKKQGIYNTPNDIVDFIIANCIGISKPKIYKNCKLLDDICDLDDFADKTVLDPTVGSGEFIINALKTKINHLETNTEPSTDKDHLQVLSTIYGNDIDISAVEICKVRLFFEMAKWVNYGNFIKVADILNRNLTNYDFVNMPAYFKDKQFDFILGNPPYVEDSKSTKVPEIKYGNIYANVLRNSVDLLSENGVMGFIVPLSYVATSRMGKIRNYVCEKTASQKIFNYADRPGCLFSGVHQKLTILIAQKGEEKRGVFTSSYNYWYKNERENLFDTASVIENSFVEEDYFPKLGNENDVSVYKKVHTTNTDNILDLSNNDKPNLFLNMRACFWIKAFSAPQTSNEFKGFAFDEKAKWSILAILNSSLFWWHWITISDCWHITRKELSSFRVPNNILGDENLHRLSRQLEKELEDTKVEINTKQANFEYKHKLCRNTIDKIDDCLTLYYDLTDNELNYIKAFAKKYREGLRT